METFKELLLNLGTSFMKLLRKVLEWFLELDLINKIINAFIISPPKMLAVNGNCTKG